MNNFFHRRNRNRFRFVILPALLFTTLFISSACLVDIRPDAIKERSTPADSEKARALLKAAVDGLSAGGGGLARWNNQSSVTVKMIDEWYGLAAFGRAWPEKSQPMRIAFVPASDNSVVEHLTQDGASTGVVWGIHDWNPWKRVDGKLSYEHDADIHFTLPTVQYFLEAPFRLAGDRGALVEYAGTRKADGVDYHVVYVTWQNMAPQDLVDQYVAYLRVDTGRLERVDCTVRDKMANMTIGVFYKEWREVDGFTLPFRVDITPMDDAPDSIYHSYIIDEWKLNSGLERTAYAPENRPPRSKY